MAPLVSSPVRLLAAARDDVISARLTRRRRGGSIGSRGARTYARASANQHRAFHRCSDAAPRDAADSTSRCRAARDAAPGAPAAAGTLPCLFLAPCSRSCPRLHRRGLFGLLSAWFLPCRRFAGFLGLLLHCAVFIVARWLILGQRRSQPQEAYSSDPRCAPTATATGGGMLAWCWRCAGSDTRSRSAA